MTRSEAIAALLTVPAEALATAIVDALTPAGYTDEWDSETIEFVLAPLMDAVSSLGWPVSMNGSEAEIAFWRQIDSTL